MDLPSADYGAGDASVRAQRFCDKKAPIAVFGDGSFTPHRSRLQIGNLGASLNVETRPTSWMDKHMRKSFHLSLTSVAMSLLLAGCSKSEYYLGKEFPPVRYRITATVETPDGPRTGSSVIETRWNQSGKMLASTGAGGSANYSGEGIYVKLPENQNLILSLSSATHFEWAGYQFRSILPNIASVDHRAQDSESRYAELDKYWAEIAANRNVYSIPRLAPYNKTVDNYPYFITFTDINDPATSKFVDPDNLAKIFGPGYRFVSLTIQVTDEPVSNNISRMFDPSFPQKWDYFSETISHCGGKDHPYFRQPSAVLGWAQFSLSATRLKKKQESDEGRRNRKALMRQVPCESLIPGYTGPKLRDRFKQPTFSSNVANDSSSANLARWTPGEKRLVSNWPGKLTIFNGCLAFEGKPHPRLILFPDNEGQWNRRTRKLSFRGKEYSIGGDLVLEGVPTNIYIDGGKPDLQSDTLELGKYRLHSCNGYDVFLVDRIRSS
jgi:hypothetical protein